jgi:glutathione S-transferase
MKQEIYEQFIKEVIPKWFAFLEKRVAKFGDGKHAVGNSFTVADFRFFAVMRYLTLGYIEKSNGLQGKIEASIFDSFPTINSIFKNVGENPKVKEWYNDKKK